MILDVMATCNSAFLSSFLSVFKRILLLIQIIVPILLIVMASIEFAKLTMNPDKKNGTKGVVNKFIAAAVVFFIPVFVDVLMGVLGETTSFSSCWIDSSDSVLLGQSRYIETSERSRKGVISDPSKYEKGDPTEKKDGKRTDGGHSEKVIFLGDSRISQMYAFLTGNWATCDYSVGGVHVLGDDVFVSQGGLGLEWMKSTGIPAAQPYFSSGTALIIEMGANDLYNVNNYIQYVNSNVGSWTSKGVKVYYASVIPFQGGHVQYNSMVASFNSSLKSGLSSQVGWIDVASYLGSSFVTTDGVHFDMNTSNKIYKYLKSQV